MKNNKILRTEKWIRVEISNYLKTQIKNPVLVNLTITQVDVSNDLSYAKIFWTSYDKNFNQSNVKDISKELEKIKGLLRHQVAKVNKAYKTPELVFKYDDSLEKSNSIENILQKIKDSNK